MKKEFEKPVLTDGAVFFLETFGKGVISKDFVGFVVNAHARIGFTLAADRVSKEKSNKTVFACRLNV